ncbi:MAG: hypothetical protein WBA45_01095 [Microthrixaceae bacterium]
MAEHRISGSDENASDEAPAAGPAASTVGNSTWTEPMATCLDVWHRFIAGDRTALGRALADDAVLHSPVLFQPVQGKELVSMYLTGASMTFVGTTDSPDTDDEPATGADAGPATGADPDGWDGRFRYVRKVIDSHNAVLEFETTMAGKYVNGVDMITCNDDGLIVDFKVMVRPRQAVEAVREMMAEALDTLQGGEN